VVVMGAAVETALMAAQVVVAEKAALVASVVAAAGVWDHLIYRP
jgi:hypothetical protein